MQISIVQHFSVEENPDRRRSELQFASKLSAIYCTVDLVLELLLFRSFVHLLPPPLLNVNGFAEDFVFGLE